MPAPALAPAPVATGKVRFDTSLGPWETYRDPPKGPQKPVRDPSSWGNDIAPIMAGGEQDIPIERITTAPVMAGLEGLVSGVKGFTAGMIAPFEAAYDTAANIPEAFRDRRPGALIPEMQMTRALLEGENISKYTGSREGSAAYALEQGLEFEAGALVPVLGMVDETLRPLTGIQKAEAALRSGRTLTQAERVQVMNEVPEVTRVTPEGQVTKAGKDTSIDELLRMGDYKAVSDYKDRSLPDNLGTYSPVQMDMLVGNIPENRLRSMKNAMQGWAQQGDRAMRQNADYIAGRIDQRISGKWKLSEGHPSNLLGEMTKPTQGLGEVQDLILNSNKDAARSFRVSNPEMESIDSINDAVAAGAPDEIVGALPEVAAAAKVAGWKRVASWLQWGRAGGKMGAEPGNAVYQWSLQKNADTIFNRDRMARVSNAVKDMTPEQTETILRNVMANKAPGTGLEGLEEGVEGVTRVLTDMRQERAQMVEKGLMTQEVFDEYDLFLKRILKKPITERGPVPPGGGKRLQVPDYRRDGFVAELPLSKDEADELLSSLPVEMHTPRASGGPVMLEPIGGEGGSLVKFTDDAAGEAAWKALRKKAPKGSDFFRPLSRDELARLDEMTDLPSLVYYTSVGQRAQLRNNELLKRLASAADDAGNPIALLPDASKGTVPEGYVLVKGPQYGPLDGQFVRKPVAEWIEEAAESQGRIASTVMGGMDAILADYLNQPKTPLINAMTNWLRYEIIGGVERLNPRNWPFYKAAGDDVAAWVTTKEAPATFKEMAEAGVGLQMPTEAHLGIAQEMNEATSAAIASGKAREFGQKWMRIITGSPLGESRVGRLAGGGAQGALREMSQGGDLGDMALGAIEGAAQTGLLGEKFGKRAQSFAERVRTAFEVGDLKVKHVVYSKKKAEFLAEGMAEPEARRLAAEFVNDTTQNYIRAGQTGLTEVATGRNMGTTAQFVGRMVGAPFFSFKVADALVLGKALGRPAKAALEGRLPSSSEAVTALRAATAISIPFAIKEGLDAATKSATGLSEKEMAEIRESNPDSVFYPSKGENGWEPRAFSDRWMFSNVTALADTVESFKSDAALANPFSQLVIEEVNNYLHRDDPRKAKAIFTEGPLSWRRNEGELETPEQVAIRLGQERMGPMTPGGRVGRSIDDLFGGREFRSQTGEPVSGLKTAMDAFLPVTRPASMDKPMEVPEGFKAPLTKRQTLALELDRKVKTLVERAESGLGDLNLTEENFEAKRLEVEAELKYEFDKVVAEFGRKGVDPKNPDLRRFLGSVLKGPKVKRPMNRRAR